MAMPPSLLLGEGDMGRGLGYSGYGEGGVASKNEGHPAIPISTPFWSDDCEGVLSKNTCNTIILEPLFGPLSKCVHWTQQQQQQQ